MSIKSIGRTAFDAVYEANVEDVYRTALCFSGDHHAAEEITQNVFMKLYLSMENVNMEAVSSWLLVTAKHMAINYKRDHGREIPSEDSAFEQLYVDGIEDYLAERVREKEYRDLAISIFSELYAVNRRWYEAVTITYLLEKPQKEVAEMMEISLDALHSMLYRAKKWIRENYEDKFNHLNNA